MKFYSHVPLIALIAFSLILESCLAATTRTSAAASNQAASTGQASTTAARATAPTTPATTPPTTPATTPATTAQTSAQTTQATEASTEQTTAATTQDSTSIEDITFTVAPTSTASDDAIDFSSPTISETPNAAPSSSSDDNSATLKAVLIPVCTVAGLLLIVGVATLIYKAKKKKSPTKSNTMFTKDLFIPTDANTGGPSGIEHALPALPAMAAMNEGYADGNAQQADNQQYMYMYGAPGGYGNEMYAYPMYANGYQYMIDPATGSYYVTQSPNNAGYEQNWHAESALPPLPPVSGEAPSSGAMTAEGADLSRQPENVAAQDSSLTLVPEESIAGQDSAKDANADSHLKKPPAGESS